MGSHTTHKIHDNSTASHEQINHEGRAREVFDTYEKYGCLTDREVKGLLHYSEMNDVRPTITKLIEQGDLIEVGTTKCDTTSRQVRLCRRRRPDEARMTRPETYTEKLKKHIKYLEGELKYNADTLGNLTGKVAALNSKACMNPKSCDGTGSINPQKGHYEICPACSIIRQCREFQSSRNGLDVKA